MNLHSYPKVYAVGHRYLAELLSNDVLVEEKIDGSQFSFGTVLEDPDHDDREEIWEYRCRSHGKDQSPPATDKMFELAVEQTRDLPLKPGWTYRGEYLAKPKHNVLCYDRVPLRNVVIFDINDGLESYLPYEEKVAECARLGLECVPRIHQGPLHVWDVVAEWLESKSFLGGPKIEGIVIKNYQRFGEDGKALMGKFVSEAFKEKHGREWKLANPTGRGVVDELCETLRTEARWEKAAQHLRENGLLLGAPQDIGPLIKAVQADVKDEEEGHIRDVLFRWAWNRLERAVIAGLPQWYKEKLAQQQFTELNVVEGSE